MEHLNHLMMKGLIYEKRDFFYSIDCDLWNYVVNDSFVPTFFYNEVVNKHINMWTIDGKIKVQQEF